MIRITHVTILIGAALVATAVVGAAAFTTAELDREATIAVTDDTDGLIELTPGATEAAFVDADGKLNIVIDSSDEGVGAVNPEATFTFGDATAIGESTDDGETIRDTEDELYLFAVAAPDGIQGNSDLRLRTGPGFEEQVTFEIVRAGESTPEARLVGEDEVTLDAEDGTIYFVVLEIGGDQTTGDELGGTLTVETTEAT